MYIRCVRVYLCMVQYVLCLFDIGRGQQIMCTRDDNNLIFAIVSHINVSGAGVFGLYDLNVRCRHIEFGQIVEILFSPVIVAHLQITSDK